MSLYPEIDSLDVDGLWRTFASPSVDGPEFAFTYYSEVALRLAKTSAVERQRLLAAAHSADADHLSAIVASLAWAALGVSITSAELAMLNQLCLGALDNPEPNVVAQAIDALWQIDDRTASNQVENYANDASPYVRGSVLRYRSHIHRSGAVAGLIAALSDPHFIVRECAVDELADLNAAVALPHLRALLNDPHPDVRQAVESALEEIEP